MRAFKNFTGVVAPLDRANVDTDAIIPKQYLKSIERTGFEDYLFDQWRYLDAGNLGDDHSKRRKNPEFVLNQARYAEAEILLTRDNFGCGSSREHAVWSLLDYGFKVVIAPSFADIFQSNALKNGLLPVVLDGDVVERLFVETRDNVDYSLTVDLERRTVTTTQGETLAFPLADDLRQRLLQGLDDIAVTLLLADEIRQYEDRRMRQAPWLFIAP